MAESRMRGLFTAMGAKDFDVEAYIASETGRNVEQHAAYMHENPDEMCEATLAHWRERGYEKELHYMREGDEASKWASYIPIGAGDGPYPLVYILHGATNPIYLAESYGFTDIAARERFVAIIPEDEHFEKLAEMLVCVEKKVNIDRSRIYVVGYSFGGYNTSLNAIMHPEFFAAAGMGGMVFGGAAGAIDMAVGRMAPHGSELPEKYKAASVHYDAVRLEEADIAGAKAAGMPVCHVLGECEILGFFPFTEGRDEGGGKGLDLSSAGKLRAVALWQSINGCEAPDRAFSPEDDTERRFGIPFDSTHTETYEGRRYFIGDYHAGGEARVQFACVEGATHWPTLPQTQIIWDFVTSWRRDGETGRAVKI